MNDMTKGVIAWAVILAAGIAVGLGIGWKLWSPKAPVAEIYAPEIRQKDGSVQFERKPMTAADAEKVVPTPQLPKGAKVERKVQVVVQANQPAADPALPLPSGSDASAAGELPERPPCPPVTVDLTLARLQDGTRRVIASSPDGQILRGVDIPIEAAPAPRLLKWAAGPSWNPADRTWGAWIERDVAFVRLGADLHQVREPLAAGGRVGWAGMIRAGIRF